MSVEDSATKYTTGHVMQEYGSRVEGLSKFSDLSLPLLVNAIESLPTSVSSPFVIADYGCADGSQNMDIFSTIIKLARRKYGDELPIVVYHEDQLGNDYNSLFKWVLEKDSTNSYACQHNNVFTMASATGFYSQCFPANFVDFGFSSLAVHWLSKLPTPIKGDFSHQLGKATDEEISAFKRQAAIDWECFLLHRARELKPGGQLIITAPSYIETLEYSQMLIMSNTWKSFVGQNIITEEEFQATNFPFHIRTVNEYKAPFEDPESSVVKAGLHLLSITDTSVISPIKLEFDMLTSDQLKAIGLKAARSVSAWGYTTFYNALDTNRPADQRQAIVDELYAKLADSMAQPANLLHYRIPALAMRVEKCARQD